MAVRVFGIIILALTSIYASDVVLPAHAYGAYHFSDFRVKGFYDVPPGWKGIHPLMLLLLPIALLSMVFAVFPGGLNVLALLNPSMNRWVATFLERPLNPLQVRDFESPRVPQNGGLGKFISLFSNAEFPLT